MQFNGPYKGSQNNLHKKSYHTNLVRHLLKLSGLLTLANLWLPYNMSVCDNKWYDRLL